MRAEKVADPHEFLDWASDVLADEARHNLILGIVNTVIRSPEIYPDCRLYLVVDGGRAVAAAAMTVPHKLIVADVAVAGAEAPLAAMVAAEMDVPGAVGNRPTISRFVAEWESISGRRAALEMEQGVFALRPGESVRAPPGLPRAAGPSDGAIIGRWLAEFAAEALPAEPLDEERMHQAIARRLSGEGPGAYWVWERAGEPMSLSGHGNPTGSGIRIGPVYTPKRLRCCGYASALVAAESRWLLENGYEFCFLYTDLSNPTSNAMYERIGYRQIATAAMFGFEPGTGSVIR